MIILIVTPGKRHDGLVMAENGVQTTVLKVEC